MNRRTAIHAAGAALITPIFLPHMQGGSPDLAALLTAAKLSSDKRLYLPAGDYVLTSALLLDVAGLEVSGDGIGKTRLLCDGLSLAGDVNLLTINADRVTLRDLSIVIRNTTGTGRLGAVVCTYACTRPTIKRIEIVGGYGTNTSGGASFDFYRHPLSDKARQYGTVEDCIARDAPLTTGFVVNSNSNVFTHCEVRNVGSTAWQHGYYVQGGYNRFTDCAAYGVSGYSYHAFYNVPNQDGSGNVFSGCLSIDPTTQHMIISGPVNSADGNNPDVPAGVDIMRGATAQGCVFRRTKGAAACGGVQAGKNVTVQGCYLEDAVGADYQAWISLGDGAIATGNSLRGTNHPAAITTLQQGIVTGAECTVIGNRIQGMQRAIGIKPGTRTLVTGNSIALGTSPNAAICVNGNGVTLRDNRIGGAAITQIGTPTGLINENNY